MPYDNTNYSRLGDGWYSERANTMESIVGQLNLKPSVKLPNRFNTGEWDSSTTKKADWLDVTVNNTSTASISQNTVVFDNGETFKFQAKAVLNEIKCWCKISLTTSGSGSLAITVNGQTVNDKVDFTSLNITGDTIQVVLTATGSVTLSSIITQLCINKTDDNSLLLDKSQVEGLNDQLTTIMNMFTQMKEEIYPVGSLFYSLDNTNPSTQLNMPNSTWERITDRYIRAKKDGDINGNAFNPDPIRTINIDWAHNHVIPTTTSLTGSFWTVPNTQSIITSENNFIYSSSTVFRSNKIAVAADPYEGPVIKVINANHGHTANMSGTQSSSTKTIDIRPPTYNMFCWVRTA